MGQENWGLETKHYVLFKRGIIQGIQDNKHQQTKAECAQNIEKSVTQLFLLLDKFKSIQPGFKPSDREEVSINWQEDMPEKQAALDKGVGTSVRTYEP